MSTQVGFELQAVQVPVVSNCAVLHSVPLAQVPLLVSLLQQVDPAGKLAPLHIQVLVELVTGSQVSGGSQHCEA